MHAIGVISERRPPAYCVRRNQWLVWLALAFSPALFTGCVEIRPTNWYVRCGPTYSNTMPTIDKLGVLIDAAVSYDRTGTNDYFDIEDSLAAVTNLLAEAQADLGLKGFTVAFVEAPFVAGFKPDGLSFNVAQKRKDSPAGRTAPFFVTDVLDGDLDYRAALIATSRGTFAAAINRGEFPSDELRSDPATAAALRVIGAKKGIRFLFVVQGSGVIVSGGKQFGQGLGTALLSGVISLGNTVVVAHNVSFLDSYVSLIDLETAEVVWSNSLRLPGMNPANPDHYHSGGGPPASAHGGTPEHAQPVHRESRWANNVLYWLPPKGMSSRPVPK